MTNRQPKIVTYMGALYDLMSTQATEANPVSDQEVLIWQGKLIDTCTSVGIPVGYYKKVVDTLRKLGCIEMISRGRRGNTPTTIALRYPPTLQLYEDGIVKSGWDDLTRTPSSDTLGAQLKDIQAQLGGIHIPSALAELHTTVTALSDRLSKVETALKVSNVPSNKHKQAQQ